MRVSKVGSIFSLPLVAAAVVYLATIGLYASTCRAQVTGSAAVGQNKIDEEQAKADKELEKLRQRESVSWGFVMQHHPELGEVLSRLKLSSQDKYQRAINDIYGTWDRLERMKKERPRRADVERQLWVIDSRIRLLAARMSVTLDNQYEDDLKKLLREQVDTKLILLEVERDDLIAKTKSAELNIDRAKENKTKDVDNRYADVKREIEKARNRIAAEGSAKKPQAGKLP